MVVPSVSAIWRLAALTDCGRMCYFMVIPILAMCVPTRRFGNSVLRSEGRAMAVVCTKILHACGVESIRILCSGAENTQHTGSSTGNSARRSLGSRGAGREDGRKERADSTDLRLHVFLGDLHLLRDLHVLGVGERPEEQQRSRERGQPHGQGKGGGSAEGCSGGLDKLPSST